MSRDKACVYDVKFFFRGRRIKEENEPPINIIEEALNFITMGIVHPGWDESKGRNRVHTCNENCALEVCLVWGRPYVNSVMEAFDS